MSEQEQESPRAARDETDVDAHAVRRRAEAEAPENAGERSESDEEPDVEAHRKIQ